MQTKEIKTTAEYWNQRANREYIYKNEKFYTITPIPYYYQRREKVIKEVRNIIEKYSCENICDFGCGDGEYIEKLYEQGKCFYGVDASEQMIENAKVNNKNRKINFEVSENGIKADIKFDLVYSVAIWAHINTDKVKELYMNIYEHLKSGGIFFLCEQVAPYYYEGENYIRRTNKQYVELLEASGFKVLELKTIDFWLHRIIFEKYFVKWLCKLERYKNSSNEEIRIRFNKNIFYRGLSSVLTKLSIPNLYRGGGISCIKNRWGYCVIIALKI